RQCFPGAWLPNFPCPWRAEQKYQYFRRKHYVPLLIHIQALSHPHNDKHGNPCFLPNFHLHQSSGSWAFVRFGSAGVLPCPLAAASCPKREGFSPPKRESCSASVITGMESMREGGGVTTGRVSSNVCGWSEWVRKCCRF